MGKRFVCTMSFALMLAPALTACGGPNYVDKDGTRYYDANDMSVDTVERGPYTKNGVYYDNPTDTSNTRDNRGMLVPGYDHDANDDPHAPPPRTDSTTVVYPNGTSTTTTVVQPAD